MGADADVEQFQLIDLLGLLVDKSLVVAEEVNGTMRYRLLETVRQYGLEKLAESGEAEAVRTRHRDHYTAAAVTLAAQGLGDEAPLVPWAESRDGQPARGSRVELRCRRVRAGAAARVGVAAAVADARTFREGVAGFDAVFGDERTATMTSRPMSGCGRSPTPGCWRSGSPCRSACSARRKPWPRRANWAIRRSSHEAW